MTTVSVTYQRPVTEVTEVSDSTDATDALLQVIMAAPEGAVIDLGGGSFHCEESLRVVGKKNLEIQNGHIYALQPGPAPETWINPNTGKTVYFGNPRSDRTHWWFLDCHGIKLTNVKVTGPNAEGGMVPGYARYDSTYEAEAGFKFNACTDIELVDCESEWTFGDGLYLGRGSFTYPDGSKAGVTGFKATNFKVSWNGRQGIALTWASDVEIVDAQVVNSKRAAVDLEPNDQGDALSNIVFRGLKANSINPTVSMRGHGDMRDVQFIDTEIVRNPFPNDDPHNGAGFPWINCETAGNADAATYRENIVVDGWIGPETGGSDRYLFEFVQVAGVIVRNVDAVLRATRKGRAVLADRCSGYVTITGNRFVDGQDISVVESAPDTVVTVDPGQFVSSTAPSLTTKVTTALRTLLKRS